MFIDWEKFKKNEKEKAKEIEYLCLKISAEWPDPTLSKEEKESKMEEILASKDFLLFKEMIEEIVPKDPFPSSADLGILALSQMIAARSITK
ncbi:MAG: hypothetical protein HZC03_02235 [Candidatus Lloydbacteria bacterium]|nr:hypothetical protein [Candidatus Lloydbacteria bacterium]